MVSSIFILFFMYFVLKREVGVSSKREQQQKKTKAFSLH